MTETKTKIVSMAIIGVMIVSGFILIIPSQATTSLPAHILSRAPTGDALLNHPTSVHLALPHRGDQNVNRPENTMAAFNYAYGHGVKGIECDIQRTWDGKFVVVHDSTWDRTTNGTGAISSTNWSTYGKNLEAGSFFSTAYATEPVPLFWDLLNWTKARDVVLWFDAYNLHAYDAAVYNLINVTGTREKVVVEKTVTAPIDGPYDRDLLIFSGIARSLLLWNINDITTYESIVNKCHNDSVEFVAVLDGTVLLAPLNLQNTYSYAHERGVGVGYGIGFDSTNSNHYINLLNGGANIVWIADSRTAGLVANPPGHALVEQMVFPLLAVGIIISLIGVAIVEGREGKLTTKTIFIMVVGLVIFLTLLVALYNALS